jgi:hypothetical protein
MRLSLILGLLVLILSACSGHGGSSTPTSPSSGRKTVTVEEL